MAEWLGHVLAALPGWLFFPGLVIIIICAIIVWFGYEIAFAEDAIPALRRRRNGKK